MHLIQLLHSNKRWTTQEHASSTGLEIISSQTNPTRKSPKHTATGTRWGPDWRKTAGKRRTDAFCSVSPPVAAEFNSTSTRDTRRPHDEALSQLPHPQRSKHFRPSPFLPPPPTLQPRGRQAAGCFLPRAQGATPYAVPLASIRPHACLSNQPNCSVACHRGGRVAIVRDVAGHPLRRPRHRHPP